MPAAGGTAVKFICAYQRPLRFERISDGEARRLYDKGPAKLDPAEMRRLQDNLVWHMVHLARESELPVQVHTGYATPSAWGDPELLHDLVREPAFREVACYLCHGGWPHHGGLALMARTFPNVYFGFCWLPALSPALAARLMDEVFDMLPANKIMNGLDAGNIETYYGTAAITREITAKVLAGKVDRGLISRHAAETLARRFLHDNAAAVFDRVAGSDAGQGRPWHECAAAPST